MEEINKLCFGILVVSFFLSCSKKSESQKISALGWGDYNLRIEEFSMANSVDSTYFFKTKKQTESGDGTMWHYEFNITTKDFKSEELARDFYSKLLYERRYKYIALMVRRIYIYEDESGLSRNENNKRVEQLRNIIQNINPYLMSNGKRTFYSETIFY